MFKCIVALGAFALLQSYRVTARSELTCHPGAILGNNPAPSAGILRAAMIFVDFPDAPANSTTSNLFNIMEPNASEFYNTLSYGRLKL